MELAISSGVVVKGTAACSSSCAVEESSGTFDFADTVACHSATDCTNVVDQFGVPEWDCCMANGYAVGACVSDTYQGIFQMAGASCN
jgi:hypothetical protein